MNGGGQATNEVVDERYPVSDSRRRETLVAGKDQRVLLLQQPEPLEGALILVQDLGSLPSRDLHLLCWCVGPWSSVLRELRAWWH